MVVILLAVVLLDSHDIRNPSKRCIASLMTEDFMLLLWIEKFPVFLREICPNFPLLRRIIILVFPPTPTVLVRKTAESLLYGWNTCTSLAMTCKRVSLIISYFLLTITVHFIETNSRLLFQAAISREVLDPSNPPLPLLCATILVWTVTLTVRVVLLRLSHLISRQPLTLP